MADDKYITKYKTEKEKLEHDLKDSTYELPNQRKRTSTQSVEALYGTVDSTISQNWLSIPIADFLRQTRHEILHPQDVSIVINR